VAEQVEMVIAMAIELAAVRLRALSVAQILDRLEDRFRLFTEGNRAAPAGHQTLGHRHAFQHLQHRCIPVLG
jgi:predicted ATPase